MGKLTKQIIEFSKTAYDQLKDVENARACYIAYRPNDERYIDLIMQKESYYYGKWAVFEGSVFLMTIDEALLQEWSEKKPVTPIVL